MLENESETKTKWTQCQKNNFRKQFAIFYCLLILNCSCYKLCLEIYNICPLSGSIIRKLIQLHWNKWENDCSGIWNNTCIIQLNGWKVKDRTWKLSAALAYMKIVIYLLVVYESICLRCRTGWFVMKQQIYKEIFFLHQIICVCSNWQHIQ